MRQDDAGAAAEVPADAIAQEAMRVGPEQYASQPGVQADVQTDGDNAEAIGGRHTSQFDEPNRWQQGLKRGRMYGCRRSS
ncbi:hypothetical protein GN244_ATG03913 [Phytophthora infestans]|uniref:Uncharacterized protein n=1 Tax=Phytophthora infestans TaxID=4787 RepID=A0A833TNB4_PHYIN|nr:hypothetical protein GN244_ATG03913 [Phytophthora infestans]